VSAVEPTQAEELENTAQTAAPTEPLQAAEPANATEATEETLPAAETQENLTARGDFATGDHAPAIAETANATEATEEALPAAETGEKLAAASESTPAYSDAPQPGPFDKKATLYIGNLFFDVTETDLVKEFSRFGTVARCKIVRDSRGLSKGYVYNRPACTKHS
jgi:RNA recognition motif-containing protein